MKTLGKLTASRDNNFNLIRLLAALGVFVSHCFKLSGYSTGGKPQLLGFICLNVFFIISGYLITKSYLNSKSNWHYYRARLLRLLPALFLSLIYSVFIVGLLSTTLPVKQYLGNVDTYLYLIKNLTLLTPDIPKQLPGVFIASNHSSVVNAPLWSLPYETYLYIGLGLFALITAAKRKSTILCITVSVLLLVSYACFVANYSFHTTRFAFIFDKESYRLSAMFLFGTLFYLLRNRIELSHRLMLMLLVAVIISSVYRPSMVAVTYAVLVYAVFYFAYIPAGLLRSFNKLGDYSYGIYVFSYPTQQLIEYLMPDLGLITYCASTFAITLVLAILSWHCVERKALMYKHP